MANANGVDNWYLQADPQVDAEFERLKAERLERAQARLLADLDLDQDFDAWKQRRLAEMQAGQVAGGRRQVDSSRVSDLRPSTYGLLWLAAMLAAIAVGILVLLARMNP